MENIMNRHKAIWLTQTKALRSRSGVSDGPVYSDVDSAEGLKVLEGRMAFRALCSCLASF